MIIAIHSNRQPEWPPKWASALLKPLSVWLELHSNLLNLLPAPCLIPAWCHFRTVVPYCLAATSHPIPPFFSSPLFLPLNPVASAPENLRRRVVPNVPAVYTGQWLVPCASSGSITIVVPYIAGLCRPHPLWIGHPQGSRRSQTVLVLSWYLLDLLACYCLSHPAFVSLGLYCWKENGFKAPWEQKGTAVSQSRESTLY